MFTSIQTINMTFLFLTVLQVTCEGYYLVTMHMFDWSLAITYCPICAVTKAVTEAPTSRSIHNDNVIN